MAGAPVGVFHIAMNVTDVDGLIARYYTPGSDLWRVLTAHSRCVADKALACAARRGLDIDNAFVEEAAMLHDIGIVECDAPSIFCTGTEPYIRHGVIGASMLRAEGLPRHARVCERHTGAGLTAAEIEVAGLPLPARDYLPETLEEKLICYADKFYSKSGDLAAEKPLDAVRRQMECYGAATLARFDELYSMFG